MKDEQLKNSFLWDMIDEEGRKQVVKWGVQDRSPFEWLAFATEELGELSEAICEHHFRDGSPEHVVEEAIQTAVLCTKIAEMYMALQEEKL